MDDWIPLAEAARRTPSHRPGKHMDRETLVRWILAGKLPAMRRGRWLFIRMADLQALMVPVVPRPKPKVQTPVSDRMRERQRKWSEEVLRARGYKV